MPSPNTSQPRPLPLFHKLWIAVPASIFLFLAACLAYTYVSMRLAPEQLRKRHLEATRAINHVYASFDREHHWPDEEAMADVIKQMPEGWRYDVDPEGKSAVMTLHGHYHMLIHYRFELPGIGPLSKRWRFSDEGNTSDFTAEVAYSPLLE